jgi:hypothetical protein
MPNYVSWLPVWRKAVSYLYILYWDRKYFSRVWSISYLIPWLLVILSAAELVGSLLHFVSFFDESSAPTRIGIASALLAVAGTVVWHHHRLEVRIERHQTIMAMTRVLCARAVEYYNPADDGCAKKFIHDALEAFVYALERTRGLGLMNACLVVRDAPGKEFRILEQYPAGTFLSHTRLSCKESAAAIAAAESGNTTVYIPHTKYIHGIRFVFEEDDFMPSKPPATTTRIIENAFQSIDPGHERKFLRSLLCMKVPNEIPLNSRVHDRLRIAPDATLVLCLGAQQADFMGEIELNSIQVTAKVIGMGLKEY